MRVQRRKTLHVKADRALESVSRGREARPVRVSLAWE